MEGCGAPGLNTKNPAGAGLRDFYVSLLDYSSGTMAPLGQVSQQEPQSRQAAASMTDWASPWLIAPAGQASAQEPQLTQAEVIL